MPYVLAAPIRVDAQPLFGPAVVRIVHRIARDVIREALARHGMHEPDDALVLADGAAERPALVGASEAAVGPVLFTSTGTVW